ncbi:D-Ala-D-Ala carboxypeptidase [Acetivibrio thermocellus AD2]|jgi:D-alanyl-D-alanine carboxypeptidase|uniref:D-Ala-D-Ala carboxypeptidase n=1 Tax=Acetivibrio thermocellus AD2 TaxID=1138384 RepID=A0AB36TJ14_ACETH|nr:M15 family metallopeptidase [Acetivibrio thermocellus]CDG36417.1 Serine-type D-Ala-D-Ala carboxypeptidase [Acetivibrio thermocellus BC1]ADU75574.1 Serine-type D-Ala-D-Ala carboxypeptidase [Acetivibrio thermocellus DSM 1313]ALX09566.1 Serine-type D-Ala-D-Ala carboxypeptidase [Acetivibrio thermocellus AD2]ANV77338.1 Serine-type D-Ala-D-Ala carboxypeptidase [Acetivibrio thermocellus DSM 2360]EIC04459.1 peptidase M15B and M15C DD-carboxypeptidase VanY/endolysin [Acetivibrio thermocellus YS]
MYKRQRILRRNKRLRYARIRTLVILVLIAVGSVAFFYTNGKGKNEETPANSYAVDTVESDDTADSHNVDAGDADTEDRNVNGTDGTENRDVDDTDGKTENKIIDDWRLILVNSDNPIPDDYSFDLSSLDEFRKFDSRAIDDLKKLIEDCRRETGGVIWVQSAYRDRGTQERLYNNKVTQYMNSGKSREEAEKLAAASVSKPGTSEHEVGLAVDFNYANPGFENTKAFKWLMENAHKYGFILRYPDGKQSITKVIYEPWHFRYVGKEHAEVIKEKGFCLEEYIEYLKNQQ